MSKQPEGYRTFAYVVGEVPEVTDNGDGTYSSGVWSWDETELMDVRYVRRTILAWVAFYRFARKRQWEYSMNRALQMLEDGASYTEVQETLGITRGAIKKRFPGYGMSSSDGGKLGMAMRWNNRELVRPTRAP